MKERILQFSPFILATLSVAVILFPAYMLSPFVEQDASDIQIAYLLRRWQTVLTVLFLTLGAVCALYIWPRSRSRVYKGALALSLAVLVGAGYMGVADRSPMFAKLEDPDYVPAAEAEHVEGTDMVMGLKAGGQAIAYPVKIVAYHHIINQRLSGEPFAVTY